MMLLDVNIVLAAHRDDHPYYAEVRPWFDRLLAGDERFGVPAFVWASFIRIATNRRIFEAPTPIAEAFAFLRAVRAQPNHVPVAPGNSHLELFEKLCHEGDAAGDLTADAYLAALAVEQGSELVSLDRDFARFRGLRWHRPGDPS